MARQHMYLHTYIEDLVVVTIKQFMYISAEEHDKQGPKNVMRIIIVIAIFISPVKDKWKLKFSI